MPQRLTAGELLGFLFLGFIITLMVRYLFVPMAKTAIMWHDRGYSFYVL